MDLSHMPAGGMGMPGQPGKAGAAAGGRGGAAADEQGGLHGAGGGVPPARK